MGMYNLVKLKNPEKCPKCGATVNEWQSKIMTYSGYDLANTLRTLRLNSRMNGEIHTSCDNCGEWLSFKVVNGQLAKPQDKISPASP